MGVSQELWRLPKPAHFSWLCVQQVEAEFPLSTRKALRQRNPVPSPATVPSPRFLPPSSLPPTTKFFAYCRSGVARCVLRPQPHMVVTHKLSHPYLQSSS